MLKERNTAKTKSKIRSVLKNVVLISAGCKSTFQSSFIFDLNIPESLVLKKSDVFPYSYIFFKLS